MHRRGWRWSRAPHTGVVGGPEARAEGASGRFEEALEHLSPNGGVLEECRGRGWLGINGGSITQKEESVSRTDKKHKKTRKRSILFGACCELTAVGTPRTWVPAVCSDALGRRDFGRFRGRQAQAL